MYLKNYIVYIVNELFPKGRLETCDTVEEAEKLCRELYDCVTFCFSRNDFLNFGLNQQL